MGNKKNIDKLFQEQFKNFHQAPNDIAWENIKNKLESSPNKKKRKMSFWLFFGSIAASTILFLFIGNQFFNTKNKITKTFSNTPKPSFSETDIIINTEISTNIYTPSGNQTNSKNTKKKLTSKKNIINSSELNFQKTTLTTTKSNKKTMLNTIRYNNVKLNSKKTVPNRILNNLVTNTNNYTKYKNKTKYFKTKYTKTSEKNINSKKVALINKNTIPSVYQEKYSPKNSINSYDSPLLSLTSFHETTSFNNSNIYILDTTESYNKNIFSKNEEILKKTIEEAIVNQKNIKNDNEVEKDNISINKWEISSNVAPVYYNTLSSGSPIDDQFSDNKKAGEINLSYGINASYKFTKKLKIRTGFNQLELGYNTLNVAVLPVSSTTGGSLVDLRGLTTTSGVNLNISNGNNYNVSQIPDSYKNLYDSKLNQRFGYLEIPLEISYTISHKKINIDIIGGFSSFFLNKNEIYSETNNYKTFLGNGNNLNKISFSTNFGIGFNYNISKRVIFKIEPMFKYQINSFTNDSGNFKPYILGIYSGFNFQF